MSQARWQKRAAAILIGVFVQGLEHATSEPLLEILFRPADLIAARDDEKGEKKKKKTQVRVTLTGF